MFTLVQLIEYLGNVNHVISIVGYWIFDSNYKQVCSAEKSDKNGHLLGFATHAYFFFLTLLRIVLPRLEILFDNNHYVLVCIFKHHTSSRVNFGLEI